MGQINIYLTTAKQTMHNLLNHLQILGDEK